MPSLLERKSWKPGGPVSCVQYSADGSLLAVGHKGNTVTVFEAVSGKVLATLEGLTAAAKALAFAPDNRKLTATPVQGGAKLWALPTK